MLILGVDVETTGLDVKKDKIIELGFILWETDGGGKEKVLWNNLVYDVEYPKLTEEITEITGIREDDLKRWGVEPKRAFTRFSKIAEDAEYIVAHNGTNFDMPIMKANFKEAGVKFPSTPWIDTSVDVPYPKLIKTRKLVHLAAEHGFLNPSAHRAYADVISMLKILSNYDIKKVIDLSKEDNVLVIAVTKAPWEDDAPGGSKEIDKAKARGYRWDSSTKKWSKLVKASVAEQEREHGEFPVHIILEDKC
jgi:DNA polymerase-3 subunit epsilon